MGELSWESYRKVLQLAEGIAPGGSIAFNGPWPEGEPEILEIPADLLEETLRCDAQGFIGGLGKMPVVRIATEKSPVLPRFITAGACKNHVLHHLISLCVNIIRRGESTSIAGDYLNIRKKRFDTGKAEMLGVPRGPLFGRLMGGDTVLVGDREVTPEMVVVVTERKIHIPGLEKYL